MAPKLGERASTILFAVIDDYIRTGEPVGSRTISKRDEINVSPATIRNIMADLEEMGYLAQPHTSAGRIPTDRSFRYYVDQLIHLKHLIGLSEGEMTELRQGLTFQNMEIKDIVRETSRLLSHISRYASVVVAPKFTETVFKYIDFVKLSDSRVLAILVSHSGMIYNKLIFDDEEISQDKLSWMSRYLNDTLADLTLKDVRKKIIREMEDEKNLYDQLMMTALSISRKIVEEQISDDLFIEGSSYIFDYPEFTDLDKMKKIFQMFEKKHSLLRLLDKVAKTDGIKIFIGSENQIYDMKDCALVASPYGRGGHVLGSIGIIGPTRMNYGKVIPIVDYAAHLVSKIIEDE
jgi:heat-inducible transcriptional repressor